ncbi:MAG: galactokinase [Spirochaetales bacterium]|nr:galactokinase [Spirochaetales bacterium]
MHTQWIEQNEILDRIYHPEDIKAQGIRYNALIEKFTQWTGNRDYLIARAPGRVNIIGEHTDYNHCPVLPCAVDRDIIAVFAPAEDGKITVADFVDKYGVREFELEPEIPSYPAGDWGNYIKAALQGLLNDKALSPGSESVKGFTMMIHSTIPAAAGMSSSSAMVVLSAIAALHVNHTKVPPLELAELMARAERYTGTQGGGMDQAAILLGEKDKALKIDFAPLKCELTPFPGDYQILIAHSTVQAPKTREVMDKYNRRSIECRLAAALIGAHEKDRGRPSVSYMGELTPDYEAADVIRPEGYSKAEIREILGISKEELDRSYCLRKDGSVFPEPEEGFLLYKRALHVISEWKRVEESALRLKEGNIQELGRLMYASHTSCRDNHEISCRELDELVDCARQHKSPGARLTGAGFGGCTVHICRNDKLDGYRKDLENCFYRKVLGQDSAEGHMFTVYPSEGARILKGKG